MTLQGWGAVAIGLGAWEATAIVTTRVPTITRTVGLCSGRRRRTTRALVVVWLLGLGRHLLREAASDRTGTVPARE